MYAGDWLLDLLGATMLVGSALMVVGGSAILLALLHAASGAGGLAGWRRIPPSGVAGHADAVRDRLRSRYMARAQRFDDLAARRAIAALEIEPVDYRRPVRNREPLADPMATLIAERATMPIVELPPLNESLRLRLAARAVEPESRTTWQRRRGTRRMRARPRTPAPT